MTKNVQERKDPSIVDICAFTAFLWKPWLFRAPFIPRHTDQVWVGDKFIIHNLTGSPYVVLHWDLEEQGTKPMETLPTLVKVFPSEYHVQGMARFNGAHACLFQKDMRVVCRKYRIGWGQITSVRKVVWKDKESDEHTSEMETMQDKVKDMLSGNFCRVWHCETCSSITSFAIDACRACGAQKTC